jgi:hypothetical protein
MGSGRGRRYGQMTQLPLVAEIPLCLHSWLRVTNPSWSAIGDECEPCSLLGPNSEGFVALGKWAPCEPSPSLAVSSNLISRSTGTSVSSTSVIWSRSSLLCDRRLHLVGRVIVRSNDNVAPSSNFRWSSCDVGPILVRDLLLDILSENKLTACVVGGI